MKVKFIQARVKGGAQDKNAHFLIDGLHYTLSRKVIRDWHTEYYLETFPGIPFNSVWFDRWSSQLPKVVAVAIILFCTNLSFSDTITLTGTQHQTLSGTWQEADLYDNSVLNVGPSTQISLAHLHGSSTLFMSGGEINAIILQDYSRLVLSGGQIGLVDACDYNSVETTGGEIGNLSTYNYAMVSINQCDVGTIYAHQQAIVLLSLHGYSLAGQIYLLNGKIYGTGNVTVDWNNGENWNVNIGANDNGNIVLNVMPEPYVLALLGAGLFFLRKK